MNSSSDLFKNQPRSGAAIRQRSQSTKELTSMLHTLRLSVQLMPLSSSSGHHTTSTKSSNHRYKSEEESDIINSNENSPDNTSEDEAFSEDYEEEEEDFNLNRLKNYGPQKDHNRSSIRSDRITKHSLDERSKSNNSLPSDHLIYSKNYHTKLRRCNSWSVLTNLQRSSVYDDELCGERNNDHVHDKFNKHSTMRRRHHSYNSSRSTLRCIGQHFSSSLKDLDQYEQFSDLKYDSFKSSNQLLFGLSERTFQDPCFSSAHMKRHERKSRQTPSNLKTTSTVSEKQKSFEFAKQTCDKPSNHSKSSTSSMDTGHCERNISGILTNGVLHDEVTNNLNEWNHCPTIRSSEELLSKPQCNERFEGDEAKKTSICHSLTTSSSYDEQTKERMQCASINSSFKSISIVVKLKNDDNDNDDDDAHDERLSKCKTPDINNQEKLSSLVSSCRARTAGVEGSVDDCDYFHFSPQQARSHFTNAEQTTVNHNDVDQYKRSETQICESVCSLNTISCDHHDSKNRGVNICLDCESSYTLPHDRRPQASSVAVADSREAKQTSVTTTTISTATKHTQTTNKPATTIKLKKDTNSSSEVFSCSSKQDGHFISNYDQLVLDSKSQSNFFPQTSSAQKQINKSNISQIVEFHNSSHCELKQTTNEINNFEHNTLHSVSFDKSRYERRSTGRLCELKSTSRLCELKSTNRLCELKSKLPVLTEEQFIEEGVKCDQACDREVSVKSSPLNNSNYHNYSISDSTTCESRMQTLAEAQYNQLSYHIAALSCVCDNKPNLTSYSSFSSSSSNQTSSVDNSPNSSEYSSPYSSPPSSPSSTSSYSSAEEDCSILTSDLVAAAAAAAANGSGSGGSQRNNNTSNRSSTNVLDKNISEISNQSLAHLITVKHDTSNSHRETSLDVVDCASAFKSNHNHHHTLVSTTTNNLTKLNDLNNNNKNNKQDVKNDDSRSDHETTSNTVDSNVINDVHDKVDKNAKQVRVRKTSILRNVAPDLANYCKKEVKFADTLGFALEKIKYFGSSTPRVKPKRHSVNLASLQRDFYDEHQELFILHSRPQTKDNHVLAKEFEERSALYTKRHSKLNLNTNIFGNQRKSRSGTYSPPGDQSHNFWSSYASSHFQNYTPMRDEYCGDMFHHSFDAGLSLNNASKDATKKEAQTSTNNNTDNSTNTTNTKVTTYKTPNSLDSFNGLNFLNNPNAFNGGVTTICSFLPLNFGQPYIQSDFPNRLRTQSVLLHSLDVVGRTINGVISVVNLTFEKKVIVKFTPNKWATEKHCEARYSKKDCDNSDKFVFQITLKESDFPQFQLNEDRTMMFAIRYETADGRVFWDNNYGQDYRLKCKFN